MNRYPLNSRVIGAGSESPLSYVSAIQNFVLEVVATAYAIRGMRVNQSLSLEQTVQTVITRLFKAAQTFALDVSLTTKTYFQKYAEAAQDFVLSTTATARQRIKRYVQAAQTFALTAQFNIRHWIKTYASAVQNFALSTSSRYSRVVLLIKTQVARLITAIRPTHQRSFKIAQELYATGSLNLRKAVRLEVLQSLYMTGTVRLRTAIRAVVDQSLELVLLGSARVRVWNPVQLQRALSLIGELTAYDVTTTPANSERTTILARDPRLVIVPGESYESGV